MPHSTLYASKHSNPSRSSREPSTALSPQVSFASSNLNNQTHSKRSETVPSKGFSTRSLLFVILFTLANCVPASAQPPKILEVQSSKGMVYGMPVHWNSVEAVILSPTGKFNFFNTPDIQNHRVLDFDFVPQPLTEARAQIQGELGREFETTISGPYVIAAPVGTSRRWQARFASLLSGYVRYFETRGWALRRPDFPLVVIVFPDRRSFERYAATEVDQLPPQAVGSYFAKSNRCILYQIPGLSARGPQTNWTETESTIVHEAIHQLAYNTGVHERLFENPYWFVEGLATMFEQPAVYELGPNRSTVANRFHPKKIRHIQTLLRNEIELEGRIANLIATDNLFKSDPKLAYALSWAMTFYISERMPVEYRALSQLQNRRGFGAYSATERQRDFSAACKTTPKILAMKMSRFFAENMQSP